ncbi:GNAT family N-acetyltransferase [Streptomyces purpurogeneiscleroticus]|uniref:GNAT family N-acetyltransferase n=1 Tax=Streptomyces purpurogeneiscleroticus TaxID=68259 RepID=UPI001CBF6B74|nr:GNAT family N-acetyltransferase [Streptomyces purpurogeneiscleroticus]MBZ4014236.1 GNAT family N-acetyltransferase [Streptomyces purpurogeneiscleroticus]
MSLEVRTVGEDDFHGWLAAVGTGFTSSAEVSKELVEWRLGGTDLTRTQGAFDGGRCVATFRSFAQELTVVGGARVPADAVSQVTVSPTHRRRGLLSRMMARDLAAAKERGDAVATLIAAEYPIYGRYGFGPASSFTEWRIDVARARLDTRYAGPQDGGRVDFATPEEVRALGPVLHDRFRAQQPGAVSRGERWWQEATGAVRFPEQPWREPFHAVYRSADGEVEGLVTYTCDDRWEHKRPEQTLDVSKLITVTPAAERALWHFLCSIDWILHVKTGHRAPDDLVPLLLGDPRAASIEAHADYLWLRPLDVPKLLAARTYTVPASLVLEVRDADGYAAGRYHLDAGPEGATCTRTTRSADLTLDVRELATLYLGDESPTRLAALGRVQEDRPGALATAEALLRTGRRPWCPDIF